PRLIVPDLPLILEEVIIKTLEKKQERRYQSGGALAEALEVVLLNPMGESIADGLLAGANTDTLPTERLTDNAPRRIMKRTLRVILADDHTLLRKTLASLLETQGDFVVVAEAGDGDSALKQTIAILPDILMLDLNMPIKGGLEVLPLIRRDAPSVKVLVLTGREEEAYIVRALRAGAHGYVLKSAEESELLEALNKIVKGQMYLGRGVAEKVVGGLMTPGGGSDAALTLSDEECRLLLLVAGGYENDQIARKMTLPMTTVIEMLARTMNKLGAKDRHAAALKALRIGAILIEDLHHLAQEDMQ
ncbi:MAG: response regulator, partial [Armatimonadetes bacterium]|nr:response regulator [Anaerolineae bacterium]